MPNAMNSEEQHRHEEKSFEGRLPELEHLPDPHRPMNRTFSLAAFFLWVTLFLSSLGLMRFGFNSASMFLGVTGACLLGLAIGILIVLLQRMWRGTYMLVLLIMAGLGVIFWMKLGVR